MAKYLLRASYTQSGAQGLLKEGGSSRRAAVEQALKSVGGSLESFYFAFGEDDAVIIADLPDHATATAVALIASAAGGATVKTTVLITPEEVDEASKKTADYRAPGA